jgi:thioredoxin-like negative regulator of GroEL
MVLLSVACVPPIVDANIYFDPNLVNMLEESTFQEAVYGDLDQRTLVMFYLPTCAVSMSLQQPFAMLGKKVKGLISLGAVDCAADAKICREYFVKRYPTLKIIHGNKQLGIKTYTGERSLKAMLRFVQPALKNNVVKVYESHLDEFLSASKNHKVVLFTKKRRTPLKLKKLAAKFSGKLLFGAASQADNEELVKQYNIFKFPSMVVFEDIQQEGAGLFAPPKREVNVYTGSMRDKPLMEYLKMLADGKAKEASSREQDSTGSASNGKSKDVGGVVAELTSAAMDEHCIQSEKLCVIILLPNAQSAPDPADPKSLPSLLRAVAERYRGKKMRGPSFKFLWAPSTRASAIAQSVGIDVNSLPKVLAVKSKGKKYAIASQEVAKEPLESFMEALTAGEVRFSRLNDPLAVPA